MKEKFIEFLQQNNAHEKYAQNTLNDHHALAEDVMERNAPELWIRAGFDWARTPQKQDYWLKLDKAWQQVLKGE